jgi:hypothetical protein
VLFFKKKKKRKRENNGMLYVVESDFTPHSWLMKHKGAVGPPFIWVRPFSDHWVPKQKSNSDVEICNEEYLWPLDVANTKLMVKTWERRNISVMWASIVCFQNNVFFSSDHNCIHTCLLITIPCKQQPHYMHLQYLGMLFFTILLWKMIVKKIKYNKRKF